MACVMIRAELGMEPANSDETLVNNNLSAKGLKP